MIALDTNVLLRVVMDDVREPEQCARARALVERARTARVSSIVFAETIWVYGRSCRASRREVARVALGILDHPRLDIEDERRLREALDIFVASDIEYADALAICDAQARRSVLHTFDRRLGRMNGARLVE